MVRWARAAALGAFVVAAACGAKPAKDAAGAAQGLLAAVVTGDEQGFETYVDRPAVREDLRSQLIGVARANGLEVDGGPSDLALDRRISPAAFHLVRAGDGAPMTTAPSTAQVAAMLKKTDGGRVCLHDQTAAQSCLAIFAKRASGWRLVGMLATELTLEVPPEPAAKGS